MTYFLSKLYLICLFYWENILYMENYNKINNGYEIILYKEYYEREAVFSIAYKYNDKFLTSVSPVGNNRVKITIVGKNKEKNPTEDDIKEILADLIDEQLKIDILKRTEKIREIIYKKAFSPIRGMENE